MISIDYFTKRCYYEKCKNILHLLYTRVNYEILKWSDIASMNMKKAIYVERYVRQRLHIEILQRKKI